jgi:uncharacterized membrane protein
MARPVRHLRSVLEGGFSDSSAARVYRFSLRALWFFFPFGIAFVAFGLLPPGYSWTGSIVIGLYALTALGSELRARSPVRALVTCAALSSALFAVEYIGVTTGVPFGPYTYTDALGGLVAGVPIAMALAWYVTIVSTWRIAQRFADRPAGRNAVHVALVSGVLTVILDVALEPMAATITRYWVWEGGAVPPANYVAWFAFAFAATWLLETISGQPREHAGLYLNALMLFLMQWVLFALTDIAGGCAVPAALSAAGLFALGLVFHRRLAPGMEGAPS